MKFVRKCKSEDYATKYLLEVPVKSQEPNGEKKSIEALFIHLPEREDGKPKSILCLSSQVGCFYDCKMCANRELPFYRSLTPYEINQQIELVLMHNGNIGKIKEEKAVEYAFIGIGEPLFGMNVIYAIQKYNESIPGVIIPDTRFSIATVGEKGTIKRLTDYSYKYPIRLELSLHFPNDSLRNQWINSQYPGRKRDPILNIENMLKETERFLDKKGGKATLNYAIINGTNNTPERLEELVSLLKGREERFYVKVMELNYTSSLVESHKRDLNTEKTYSVEEFKGELEKRGVHAILFKSKGVDIRAGCGMMAVRD